MWTNYELLISSGEPPQLYKFALKIVEYRSAPNPGVSRGQLQIVTTEILSPLLMEIIHYYSALINVIKVHSISR